MPLERRHCRRYPLEATADAWLGRDSHAIIQNVGGGGIGIQRSSALKPDCDVEIRIMLSTNAGILDTRGKVIWASESGDAGIQLPLQEWQEYLCYWQSHGEEPPTGSVQLNMPPPMAAAPSTATEQLQIAGEADDERALRELRACWLRSLEADLEAERVWAVRRRYLAGIALTGLICALVLWAVRDKWSRFEPATTSATASTVSEAPEATASLEEGTAPPAPSPQRSEPQASLPVADGSSTRPLGVLPGISYQSGPNFARFFINVGKQQKLHPVALKNPDRIYFDVPKSVLKISHKSVDMENDFVHRMRVSQRGDGLTRVVLDLKCSCTYRVQPASGRRRWVEIEVKPRSMETARLHTKPLS